MSLSAAAWRFNLRFLGSIAVYGVLMTGATWIAKNWAVTGVPLIALAVLSALPIAVGLFVTGRYLIEETDEYVRQRVVTCMLFSVGVLLSIGTVAGFLQQQRVIGGFDLLWAFPAWCLVWSLAQMWLTLRDRVSEDAA
jgi:hypothetical protein